MSYIDTSVIVAALDPLDPRCARARDLLEKEEDKVISELVLAELASIVARREELVSDVASKLGLDRGEVTATILLYLLRRFNLRYRSVHGFTRAPLLGRMYRPIATAMELSSSLRLRALDLLHIAYAKLMKDGGEPIRKLVTVDKGFEKAEETLKREMGIDLNIIQT